MELQDTITLMVSDDYKDRFVAEYVQLRLRIVGIQNMLSQYVDGTLQFTPTCGYNVLNRQLQAMILYSQILETRAQEEEITLDVMKGVN